MVDMYDFDTLKVELLGRSSVRRRKAAMHCVHISAIDMCALLRDALLLEERGRNSWKTKYELIRVIGLCKCVEIAPHIYEHYVARREEGADILTMVAAQAFFRAKRQHKDDIRPLFELIDSSDDFVHEGVLETLGYDQMVPDVSVQDQILNKYWDLGRDRTVGLTDPRYGLAAACAGWNSRLVRPFLLHCLESNDAPLIYVAEKALKGVYVKLR